MMQGQVFRGLKIYTDADETSTFDPSWTFSDASVMTVNWGDGTPQESHATALTHTYAAGSGRKLVRFSCPDWTKLTTFDVNVDVCKLTLPSFAACTGLTEIHINENQFSGPIPSFAPCTLLTQFWAHVNQFSGTLPSFAACTGLQYFTISSNPALPDLISGILPSFATCTGLIYFSLTSNTLTGYAVGGFATQRDLNTINLSTNSLPVASIDAILADCVTSLAIPGRVVCTLTLDGVGMAPPSNPAGLANKATLVAAGWTVTTN
jgi:hypothetical protein